uniref:Reverse transcriptase zinc-binding domain-containing protein n=1 Tax=Opuntia streptacantha TaxID=393608 RepID=A0A7C8ZEC0_OPUST
MDLPKLKSLLNTKELLYKLQESQNVCTFCSTHSEDLDHVLIDCSFSWKVWCAIANDLGQQLSRQPTFKQFYEVWIAIPWRYKRLKNLWISTVFTVAWRLWMVRNEIIFQQKELSLVEVCHSIKWKVALWTKAWKQPVPYTVEDVARNFSSIPVLFH